MSTPIVLEEPATLTPAERIRGLAAVGAARVLLTLTRGRPGRVANVLRIVRLGTQPADAAAAARARACVVTVSLRCASDRGCLLRSLATVLACRFTGSVVIWKVGVASPPPALHAWVEASDTPIGEPFDPRLLYRAIITN